MPRVPQIHDSGRYFLNGLAYPRDKSRLSLAQASCRAVTVLWRLGIGNGASGTWLSHASCGEQQESGILPLAASFQVRPLPPMEGLQQCNSTECQGPYGVLMNRRTVS